MLLNGFNHVAVLTKDTKRFVSFYKEVFEAEVFGEQSMGPMGRLTLVRIGGEAEINLFELSGNTEADRQAPMFGEVGSTIWASKPLRWGHSRRSATV